MSASNDQKKPDTPALETISIKDAVALLFSFAQAINPMDDLHLEGGRLLLTKGTALSGSVIQTLQGFGNRKLIPNQISVQVPEA